MSLVGRNFDIVLICMRELRSQDGYQFEAKYQGLRVAGITDWPRHW